MGPTGVQGATPRVHGEHRERGVLEVDRRARAGAVERRAVKGASQPNSRAAGVNRDRERTYLSRWRSVYHLGTKGGGYRQSVRLVVQVCDPRCTQRYGQPSRVQPNRIRSRITADHEYLGCWISGKLWTDGSPGIRKIVTGTCDGDRIDPLRKLHEHGVRVWNKGKVGQEPSPLKTTHRAEAIG